MSTDSTSPEFARRRRWRWPEKGWDARLEMEVGSDIGRAKNNGMMVEETQLGGVDVNVLWSGNMSFRGNKRLGEVL